MLTGTGIYSLVQRLHTLIPKRLRRWTDVPAEPADRDALAEAEAYGNRTHPPGA